MPQLPPSTEMLVGNDGLQHALRAHQMASRAKELRAADAERPKTEYEPSPAALALGTMGIFESGALLVMAETVISGISIVRARFLERRSAAHLRQVSKDGH